MCTGVEMSVIGAGRGDTPGVLAARERTSRFRASLASLGRGCAIGVEWCALAWRVLGFGRRVFLDGAIARGRVWLLLSARLFSSRR